MDAHALNKIDRLSKPENSSSTWWRDAHGLQLKMCDALEEIADSLPANIDRQMCIVTAKCMASLMREAHKMEETVLFSQLEALPDRPVEFSATVERLKFEHFADECYAEEIAERLLYLGAGGTDVNMEATGYMLRGFFEALRRHIAFEQEHLVRLLAATEEAAASNSAASDRH
ncbi:hemerythrin domain-containing protein [Rhizobium sp. KVB221]|uniref:Hemerythrin domain-containing protein n=1 Tax=Rhizobium setariae TaxID=2801340 RepID=A0A937CQ06_9HYPH|nr:hemerythrin domain-containing protein [Rhizobium setariae]MBL0373208.1 hemerythrin domain-containing protein [Rhizobium setariae]